MRIIVMHFENGYVGCDQNDYTIVFDEVDDKHIEDDVRIDFNEYLSEYEHVAQGYDWEEGWLDEESEEDYYQGGSYEWKEVSKEEFREFCEEEGFDFEYICHKYGL